jgi:hypothetical protein
MVLVIDLCAFHLPLNKSSSLEKIETIEESEKMQYITSVEKIGIAKGRLEGHLEGRLEGQLEGRLEGESKLLRKLLERRFGTLPTWASDKLNFATEKDLEFWAETVLSATCLEAVFEDGASH